MTAAAATAATGTRNKRETFHHESKNKFYKQEENT